MTTLTYFYNVNTK